MSTSPTDGDRPLLSVAIIARDATAAVRETLDAVRAIADELVVFDMASSDDTAEVCRAAGARVIEGTWEENLADARNQCAAAATGQWLLWLDPGETLDNNTAQQVRQFVGASAQYDKAYMIYVAQIGGMTEGDTEQIGQIRLLPNRPEIQFEGRVRESVFPSLAAAGIEIDLLCCQIHRWPAELEPDYQQMRAERNLRLADLALADGDTAPTISNVRAESLAALGRTDEAEAIFRRVIGAAPRGSTEQLEAYYGLLTIYDGRTGGLQTQSITCLEALDVFPLDAQLLCAMGCYLLHEGRLDLAARSYELAASHGQIDPATSHVTDLADVATTCLSLTLQLLGERERAEEVLSEALDGRPDSVRLRRVLIELLVKARREGDALAQVSQLPPDLPHADRLAEVVRGAMLVTQGKSTEALPRLQAAYDAGCHDPLCLRWLAAAAIEQGEFPSAQQILGEWETREPASLEVANFHRLLAERIRRSTQATGARVDPPQQDSPQPAGQQSSRGIPTAGLGGMHLPTAAVPTEQ